MEWSKGKVIRLVEMGEGSRVEIDFVDVLSADEGVLVGDSACGYVCVLAETRSTATYPPRPFRVNAGAVHQYVQIDENRTKYLSEIDPGDRIMVTDGSRVRYVSVGRVKMEKREFVKVCFDTGISATLQKADSLFLKGVNGAIHFIDIKEGDEVSLVMSTDVARHKGEAIDEFIEEK